MYVCICVCGWVYEYMYVCVCVCEYMCGCVCVWMCMPVFISVAEFYRRNSVLLFKNISAVPHLGDQTAASEFEAWFSELYSTGYATPPLPLELSRATAQSNTIPTSKVQEDQLCQI